MTPFPLRSLCLTAFMFTPLVSPVVTAAGGPELIDTHCSECHELQEGERSWSRISNQRKTPEGWDMTLARMQIIHGLSISGDERRAIVKYLADHRGLAPGESAPERALIERRLNRVESFDHPLYQEMCARCHTGGRALLQRRTKAEWQKLVHFHVGQFQTLEYQAMARDRDWLTMAMVDIVPWLAGTLGNQSESWDAWQEADHATPEGEWQLWGHWPGEGAFVADFSVQPDDGEDAYAVTLDGEFIDGRPLTGDGPAVVYTGYEWRANLTLNDQEFKQVLDLSRAQPSGRIFDADDEAYGMMVDLLPAEGDAGLVATLPVALKAGDRQRLMLIGRGLASGEVDLGEHVEILDERERSDRRIILDVAVAEDLEPGWLPLQVGELRHDRLLAGYRTVDYLKVEPELGIARVGSQKTPPVSGVFSAFGYLEGEVPIPLGQVPVQWTVEPWDALAEQGEDAKFAGILDSATGIFAPSGAGPNELRPFSANNVGNLRLTASVEGQEDMQADAQLIVTVQRWNNPPLR